MFNKKPVLIVLSLAIAIFLWAYVMGEVDPETTVKISNINLQYEGEDTLAQKDLAVVHDSESTTVSATVKGKRSTVHQAKVNGFNAKVDVSTAKKGSNELQIKFETPAGVSIDTSTTTTKTEVTVEDRTTKEVPVELTFSEWTETSTVPWVIATYPAQITVQGAKSSVAKVNRATAILDPTDARTTTQTVSVDVVAVDINGNIISGLEYSEERIAADIKLLNVATVPVNVTAKGLKSSLEVATVSDVEVQILADEKTIKKLNSVEGTVDLSSIEAAGQATLPVELDLPWNVYEYSEDDINVVVTTKDRDTKE